MSSDKYENICVLCHKLLSQTVTVLFDVKYSTVNPSPISKQYNLIYKKI